MPDGDDFDPKRVLVVDDDGPMLRTHGRVLEAHGLRPVLMADPGEALEEAKQRIPAVVVLDLVMPGMSGLEYVTRLRTHYQRECPPIILVSANHAHLSPMEQLLFDAIFPKPYAIDRLIQCVRRFAREHYEHRMAPSEVLTKHGAQLTRNDENEA